MEEPISIAVLMTCFNRRDLTIACLERLRDQPHFREENLFLVDDGSSDGTGAAVREMMPAATLIQGDGSLFWNGGMRLAWEKAKASGRRFDFYMWLNDDVRLERGALAMMVADAKSVAPEGGPIIIAAATTEPGASTITYGAHRRTDSRRPLRLSLVAPQGRPVPVDTISGNMVLVSAAAERILGNMLPDFQHIYGDLDYGFRALAAGIPMALASRPGGTCGANSLDGSSLDPTMGKIARLRRRWSEDKKVHARDWRRLIALHSSAGFFTILAHRVAPYARIVLDRPHRHSRTIVQADQPMRGDG